MRIVNRQQIVDFWTKHRDAEKRLRDWIYIVERVQWRRPVDVRAVFPAADFLPNNRIVFDVKGNTYRIVAALKYEPEPIIDILFIGTHAQYEKIDAKTVGGCRDRTSRRRRKS